MKKIGILTYWGVPNYGAWCQAYALNNVVRSLAGHDAEVIHINYLNEIHYNLYYKSDSRLCNAFSYSWNIIPHTNRLNAAELENSFFDTIITGSDAIWEFSVKAMGDDPHLIGNNLNTENLVSYAASCGVTTPGECSSKDWVGNGLSKYDTITVRDENTYEFVQELSGKKSEIVVDPSLLWDFNDDPKIKKPVYNDYIAVYGMNWDEEYITEAKNFARDRNLKLISIGFLNDWCDLNLRMVELRTVEWIGFLKKAEYVFTSTFHGLMMGLDFRKQIKFDMVSYVKNRAETLIDKLGGGLELTFDTNDFSSRFRGKLDYGIIDSRLSLLRQHSIDFLKDSLLK